MGEWKECKLGDVLNFKRGYDLPKSERKEGLIPIVSSSGISGYHDEYKVSAPGVVTGRYGTIGSVYYVDKPFWPLNTTLYITDFKGNDPKFIFYFLHSFDFEKYSDKSTVPGVNRNHLHLEDIIIPPLSGQRDIASVLSSLDDKIDLLHRQNATLESMAEALFRQWFVVEAKEEWEEGVLGDIVNFNYGKGLKDSDRSGNGFPVYGSNGIVGHHSEYLVEGPGIVTGRKGTLGVINYSFENFYPIDTTFYITSRRGSKGLYYEYLLLKVLKLDEMNTDSAVPGLNRNLAHSIQVNIPTTYLVQEFNLITEPIFLKIKTNKNQIRTLTALRDTLLPKLMSGEVRVEDTEHVKHPQLSLFLK